MKIKLNQLFYGLNNKHEETVITDSGSGEPLLLKWVIYNALVTVPVGKQISNDEKYKRGGMAKILENPTLSEWEVDSKEVTLIKECVGDIYPPYVVRIAWDMIEGTYVSPKKPAVTNG